MTAQVQQRICIKFYVKPEHSSMETIRLIQKAASMSNWWSAASSPQGACSCITPRAEFSGEIPDHPGNSVPLQPRFGAQQCLALPKTKITFEREGISDCWWHSEKYDETADGDREYCVRSQGAYFEWDSDVIVLCTMFLVSSSINVSIFHITWLDTFWADLIYAVIGSFIHSFILIFFI